MSRTYLTAVELSKKIPYHPKYINDSIKDRYFIEGTHYVRPFGKRRVLYIWEEVEKVLFATTASNVDDAIPMMSGGLCHG